MRIIAITLGMKIFWSLNFEGRAVESGRFDLKGTEKAKHLAQFRGLLRQLMALKPDIIVYRELHYTSHSRALAKRMKTHHTLVFLLEATAEVNHIPIKGYAFSGVNSFGGAALPVLLVKLREHPEHAIH
jgi:hypothetical protein